jgi:diguanylate cyclase (GGDEF)-like protein
LETGIISGDEETVQSPSASNDDASAQGIGGDSLLEALSDALIVCDDAGYVGYLNAHAEHLLGVDARLVIGRPVDSLLTFELPLNAVLTKEVLARLLSRQGARDFWGECVLLRGDGLRVAVTSELVAIGPATLLIIIRPTGGVGGRISLTYRATHDVLTGLLNRSCMQERLASLHRGAEAQRGTYSLLLLDLDHFKIVNDRFGHATGDQVLAQVGRRITHNLREMDLVGRWGGEEFLCLLPQVNRSLAEEIAERIRAGLEARPIEYQGRQIRVTSSIGVASYPDDGLHPDPLLAKADAALYEAKRSGRNRIQSVTRHAGNVFALANIIEKSLREDRLLPAYQSVVNLVSGEVCGAEALARIQVDDHQLMEASYFIPAAEQLHLVHLIDHRIIQSAVMTCVAQLLDDQPLSAMFVNFSADFLRHPDLVEDILDTIKQQWALCGDRITDVKPLVIEITERQFMDDMGEAREALAPFLDLGIRIAIDDFGAGYSSLNYLAEFPVSFVKLEGSLVRRVASEPRVKAIVQGIQDLAVDLGIITVAEGVESQETVDALRRIGVDWGQGYYFFPPRLSK